MCAIAHPKVARLQVYNAPGKELFLDTLSDERIGQLLAGGTRVDKPYVVRWSKGSTSGQVCTA